MRWFAIVFLVTSLSFPGVSWGRPKGKVAARRGSKEGTGGGKEAKGASGAKKDAPSGESMGEASEEGQDAAAKAKAKENKAKARQLFKKGKKLFKKKDYDAAIAAFKEAYAIWKHRVIIYNLAVTYAYNGNHIQAAVHAREFLKKAKGKEKNLPEVLQRSMKKVGMLIIRVPDPKAAIYVDGRQVGLGTAELMVSAGVHVMELRQKDRVIKRMEIRVEGGKEKVWELAEMPKPPRKPPRVRPRPRPRVRPRPRPPRVVIQQPPKKKKKKLGTLHWGVFASAMAVTAGSLAGAISLSVKTRSLHNEFQEDKTDAALADQGKNYQLGANILWGVTAAAAVGTAVVAIFTDWKGSKASEEESPTPKEGERVSFGVYPGGGTLRVSF